MNLYVGNLLSNVSEKDLRNAFEEFGQVREVRLIADKHSGQSKGYGFVEMPSKNDAEKAISQMNGRKLMGRTVNVNPAKPKVNRRHGGSRGRDSTGRGQRRRY